jgi:hypothetical protein
MISNGHERASGLRLLKRTIMMLRKGGEKYPSRIEGVGEPNILPEGTSAVDVQNSGEILVADSDSSVWKAGERLRNIGFGKLSAQILFLLF